MNISDNHYKKEWRWIENASHLFTENGKYSLFLLIINFLLQLYN